MLKKIIVIGLVLGCSYTGFAQKLEVESNFWGTRLKSNGEAISIKDLVKITSSNKLANDFALKAKTNKGFSDAFGGVGGFIIGWSFGIKIGGGELNENLIYTGLGLIGVGIPFSIGMAKNTEKSVEAFNGNSGVSSVQYSFIANSKGIGLSLNF